MKLSLFALGLLTGVVSAYVILTRWWWPDIRLEQAHLAAEPAITPAALPSPSGSPSPGLPQGGGPFVAVPSPFAAETHR